MNLAIYQNIFAVIVTIVGSFYDVKFRRVPNWLTFGSFGIALIYNITTLKIHNILFCVCGFLVGIGLLIIPYILGGMGAGDVKLLGAIGSIVGYKNIICIFIYTAISGMLLGIIWMLSKPDRLKFLITTGQVSPTIEKKEKVPYAIAIFLGTVVYILLGDRGFQF